jgi:hypothetical protein
MVSASRASAQPIQHDAEHYVLLHQYQDQWDSFVMDNPQASEAAAMNEPYAHERRLTLARAAWTAVVLGLSMGFGSSLAQETPSEPDAEEAREAIVEEEEAEGGAAASDPTAAQSFQDLRYRYFDLDGGGHRHNYEAEGSIVFHPRFKVTHELVAVTIDRDGESETDLQQLSLKPIFLTPFRPFGVDAVFALGGEWLKDLGRVRNGTGTGSDQIAPLAGVGWKFTETDTLITLVQYFHSYRENDQVDEVRQTGPRVIYLRELPQIGGWVKADLKAAIDHEDDNDLSATFEAQLGKMLTERIGVYGEVLLGDVVFDTNAYDYGLGVAIRVLF